MRDAEDIIKKIREIDGRDYGAYQALKGAWDFGFYKLFINRIPQDPYAPPFTGIYQARLPRSFCFIPAALSGNPVRTTAYRDFMVRRFYEESRSCSNPRGTGNSGIITVEKPGQAILDRSSIVLTEEYLELRFFLGLPAEGRLIKGETALLMIREELPRIIRRAFHKEGFPREECLIHLDTAETAHYLRSQLAEQNLVCFVAEGAILPRISGSSDKPLDSGRAVGFSVPPSLTVAVPLPDGRIIRGMGIPRGVTLIVGGGYHGKSTLLQALASGIYNHIPGDGREQVVSCEDTLKMRAYSGRSVVKVNISAFIRHLPTGADTSEFSAANASGSTSQAAALMEGLEMGARLLLMDEDTCASNFMIRDNRMQQLVPPEEEPITPFIDRARELYEQKGVSTILVLGGSGDYFEVSDRVIQMKAYRACDVTEKALSIAGNMRERRRKEGGYTDFGIKGRVPLSGSIDPLNAYGKKSVYAREVFRINFGRCMLDLADVEQIQELPQTKAIMEALLLIEALIDGKRTLREILDLLDSRLKSEGLDGLCDRVNGSLAEFRMIELASAFNRLRSIKIK